MSQLPPDRRCLRHSTASIIETDKELHRELLADIARLSSAERDAVVATIDAHNALSPAARMLLMRAILLSACHSQLVLASELVQASLCVDVVGELPDDIAIRILGCLDAQSLGRCAQVSRRWRAVADADRVWRRLCSQHINKRCKQCGWALPLLYAPPRPPAPASVSKHQVDDDALALNTSEDSNKRRRLIKAECDPGDIATFVPTAAPIPLPPRPGRTFKQVYLERLRLAKNFRDMRYNARLLPNPAPLDSEERAITAIKLHPPFAFIGTYSGHVGVYCLPTATFMFSWLAHEYNVDEIGNQERMPGIACMDVDSVKLITAGNGDRSLAIWDYHGSCADHAMEAAPGSTIAGRLVRRVDYPVGVLPTAVASDEHILVAGSSDSLVRVWPVASSTDKLSSWAQVDSTTAQCIVLHPTHSDGALIPRSGISRVVIWQKRWILASSFTPSHTESSICMWDWQEEDMAEGVARAPIRLFEPATPSAMCNPSRFLIRKWEPNSFSLIVPAFSIDAVITKLSRASNTRCYLSAEEYDECRGQGFQDAVIVDMDPARCCVVVYSLRSGVEIQRWYNHSIRCFSSDRFRVAVGGFYGTVTLHDLSDRKEDTHKKLKMPLDGIFAGMPAMNAVANGDAWVLAGDIIGHICLWDFS